MLFNRVNGRCQVKKDFFVVIKELPTNYFFFKSEVSYV